MSSVAYPPDVPRANATRSSIFPRHSASTSIPLDPSPWSKTSTPVLALPFLYPFPPLAAGALAPNTSGDLFCACPYSASFHQSVAFIQSFLRLLLGVFLAFAAFFVVVVAGLLAREGAGEATRREDAVRALAGAALRDASRAATCSESYSACAMIATCSTML